MALGQADPQQLIQLAKQGDEEAFNQLYQLYLTPIYRYLYLRLKHKQQAEDLTQAVFVKIYQSLDKITDFSKPLAYFFTIARNTLIDYYRTHKAINLDDEKVLLNIPDSKVGPHARAEKQDDIKALTRLIGLLSPDQQEIIILKFINDLTNKEIAALINKSEEAIRQLQSRAIKSLKNMLKEKPL
jgi:RNA polymerase sigma-70 factor (ECF subfamily)